MSGTADRAHSEHSLWSIAWRLLGRNASPGRIAHAVNRLRALTEKLITGNRGLLHTGTEMKRS